MPDPVPSHPFLFGYYSGKLLSSQESVIRKHMNSGKSEEEVLEKYVDITWQNIQEYTEL